MNNKTFLENYRANAPLSGTISVPELKRPGQADSFAGTRGKMADDYGRQQNIIGMTALGILLSAMGLAPEAIAATAFGSRVKGQERSPLVKGIPVESEPDNAIIDKTPNLNNLFKELTPISPDSSREEIIRGLEKNSKIIEQTRNLINERKRRGYGL